jgi:hypothetical protein
MEWPHPKILNMPIPRETGQGIGLISRERNVLLNCCVGRYRLLKLLLLLLLVKNFGREALGI